MGTAAAENDEYIICGIAWGTIKCNGGYPINSATDGGYLISFFATGKTKVKHKDNKEEQYGGDSFHCLYNAKLVVLL